MKILSFLLVASILYSCCLNEDKNITSMNTPKRDISLVHKEVFIGNIQSYEELKIIHLDLYAGDFLYYALFMANKHDYPPAYLDVFFSIVNSYGGVEKFYQMDSKTQKIAMDYLIMANDRQADGASEILFELEAKK
jgi:hypothetical protein